MTEHDVKGEAVGALGHRDGLWARAANLLVSGWLVVSAFAWERAAAPRTNAAVVAYLVFVLTVLATSFDGVRALNTLLGLWLIASAWVIPPAIEAMRWNTVLAGVAVVLLSWVSSRGGVRPPPVGTLLHRIARAPAGVHPR